MAFCEGELRPGFDLVARLLDLDRRIDQANVILTGEGRLDDQT
jgi:glycerate kinase